MLASQDERLVPGHPLLAQGVDVRDQDDGVVHHDPREQHQPQHRGVPERLPGELQRHRHPDERERDREHDHRRMEEALEERHHDQVDQQQREREGEPRRGEVGLAHAGPAVEAPFVARRQGDVRELFLDLAHEPERSSGDRGVRADGELGTAILALDAARPAHRLEVRHRAHRNPGVAHEDRHAPDVVEAFALLLGVLDHDVHLALVALDRADRPGGQRAADGLSHREGSSPGGERPFRLRSDVEFLGPALERGVHVPDPGKSGESFNHPARNQFEDVHVVALQIQPDAAAPSGTATAALGDPEVDPGDRGQHSPDLVGDLLDASFRFRFIDQIELEAPAAPAVAAAAGTAPATAELVDHVRDLEFLAPLLDERRHGLHHLAGLVERVGPGYVHVDRDLAFDRGVEAGPLGVLVEGPGHAQQPDRHQQRDEPVLQGAPDDLPMETAQEAHRPGVHAPFVPEHDPGHHRHHGERDEQRGDDHHAQGESEVGEDAEEPAHRGPEEDERHEHAHGGRRAGDDRHGHRGGAVDRRGSGVFLVLGEVAGDRVDDHDRRIGKHADGHHQPEEADHVERGVHQPGLPAQVHDHESGDDRERDRHRDQQRGPHLLQEEQQDEHREPAAEEPRQGELRQAPADIQR